MAADGHSAEGHSSEYLDISERDIFKCWLSEVAQERKDDDE